MRLVTDENKADAVTAPTPLYEPDFTFTIGGDPDQPAVTMSHFAARQYTKWLSLLSAQTYRLPTEAEWEYAARAGTTTAYFFGDDPEQIGDYAWFYDNADEAYHPVGSKKPNPWGLHDIYGNVAELTLDQYKADTYQTGADSGLSADDAVVWTTKMFPHAVRGGGFYDDPPKLRSAARGQTEDWRIEDPNLPRSPWWFTDEPALAVGFRLVRPLKPADVETRAKWWEVDNEVLGQAVEDRLNEGRGALGLVDPELPGAAAK
jgi:formylglycine-generating enzyme required for sulfatase activity